MKVEKRLILLDYRRRKYYNKVRIRRSIINYALKAVSISIYVKQLFAICASDFIYNLKARSEIHSRCILTGRGYGISLKLRMSRFASRVTINSGYISGVRRHS